MKRIRIRTRRSRGLSLVELLVALAISALLLTATMVATDASFKAYADASNQFSTQAATRMVTDRLLTLLRTSTAQGPLQADSTCTPAATLSGDTVTSPYIEMIDPNNLLVRIEWHSDTQQLWMIRSNLDGSNKVQEPLIGGVTSAIFYCQRRKNAIGQWILARATMDLTILPGADAADSNGNPVLGTERGTVTPIRVVGSTMPRKLEDE